MQIYYPSFQAIEQSTKQLENEQCHHCRQTQQLISHGMVYKKQSGGEPAPIGKRVFCSNRNQHTGCGRTMRFYLDTAVRYLHYTGWHVVAFVLALIAGMSVQQAYCRATGTADPRHAYRWLHRLCAELSGWRSLCHQRLPALTDTPVATPTTAKRQVRRSLLGSTFQQLLQHFGQPLCANYQRQLQRSFL